MSIQLTLKNEIISTLAVFGAVAFRLIPTTTRLLHCFARIKFGVPIINTLHNEKNIFDIVKDQDVEEVNLNDDIEFKNCSFFYNENIKLNILKNVNLRFKKMNLLE